ncbi:MAG: DNA methyltransferase [candidate division WOR-3 bacterium]
MPDSVFEWLFEPDSKTGDKKKGFLEIFNFTIDESLPLDVEVAVDPEMLGKVYESLIAEEERGSIGIFYTPRAEIDLMCRLSLIEYLYNETKIEKNKLIDFVFMPQSIQNFAIEEARKVKSALDKVKIVDPAVGSASFMVGMMNILVELHYELTKKIENKEENLFALKQKIILENLYGVDVKDWAVMVGELRLWLSLIIDTDEKYMDIYTKPLLPNLSFKIRQGDSLVEEIGGVQISLRGEIAKYIPRSIADKIKKLIDRKNDFFSGKYAADLKELEEIEKLEQEIFTDILNQKIEDINKKITSFNNQIPQLKGQKNLYGEENKETKSKIKKLEDQIKELEKEKDRYEKVSNSLKTKKQKDYFLWEIDFAEVFATKGGFDIVIGNPPYVKQELIAPPLEDKSRYTEKEWKELKEDYKDRLGSSVKSIWKNVTIDKRSDLYVYFYYHGLSLLREGGIFCFINSNSWLDVGYGAGLQEFLLKRMRPIYIIDNLRKRSFKQADVNTVIVLIQRPKEELDDYTVKFVAFKKPFEEVVNAEVIKRLESIKEPVFDDEDFRVFPKSKRELLLEGSEIPEEEGLIGYSKPEELVYVGNKWGGKYLRAPEIYFKILEKGKGKLVRLGDIAEVRRGFTTGANEFFYLKPIGMSVKEVVEIAEKNPSALIPVKNKAGWEGEIEARFLKPVIKSPRELKTIIVRLEDLNYLVFMCHKDKRELAGTKALEYIKWGEKEGYQNRPTCRGRERWWDLGEQEISLCGYPMVNYDRLIVSYNNRFFNDANIVGIYPKLEDFNNVLLVASLNFSFMMIYWELYGISNLGEGAIKQNPIYFRNFYIFNFKVLMEGKDNLHNIFNSLSRRSIKSIFTELGFDPNKPIREQEPNPLPDRKALDDIVFDALGLTEEERKEVYWAVAELVKNRLEKARSV